MLARDSLLWGIIHILVAPKHALGPLNCLNDYGQSTALRDLSGPTWVLGCCACRGVDKQQEGVLNASGAAHPHAHLWPCSKWPIFLQSAHTPCRPVSCVTCTQSLPCCLCQICTQSLPHLPLALVLQQAPQLVNARAVPVGCLAAAQGDGGHLPLQHGQSPADGGFLQSALRFPAASTVTQSPVGLPPTENHRPACRPALRKHVLHALPVTVSTAACSLSGMGTGEAVLQHGLAALQAEACVQQLAAPSVQARLHAGHGCKHSKLRLRVHAGSGHRVQCDDMWVHR